MLQSPRLTISISILAISSAIVLATTPCGWPQSGDFHSGGQCNWDGWNHVCSQPHVVADPKCTGKNNPNTCDLYTYYAQYETFKAKYENTDCRTGGCVKTGNHILLTLKGFSPPAKCIEFKK